MADTRKVAVASIHEDISNLNGALSIIGIVHLKLPYNENLEEVIRILGGEIAVLKYKRDEAAKYFTNEKREPINIYGENGELFPPLKD